MDLPLFGALAPADGYERTDAGRPIRCRVGTGLSATDRTHFWKLRERLAEVDFVEVAYKDQTLARGAAVWSLAQPRFVRTRAALGGGKL